MIAATPIDILKAWMAFRIADFAAPYMSSVFDLANFDFRQKTLSGQMEPAPRWKRGKLAVAGEDCGADPASCFGTLDWAAGELYAERYFPAATKAAIEVLVGNMKAAFRQRLEDLDWMSQATKAEALKKLDTYTIKVGYPDKCARLFQRRHPPMTIFRQCPPGRGRRTGISMWSQHAGPVDKTDWSMTPQTNDAYNGSLARHRLPGRHPAGADLRCQRRSRN